MNKNPFVLPGFGQSGQLGQNPILASMEMMRQAWEGLASTGGLDTAAMAPTMSIEEMDKRISDLRAVENWLRMNLSMLSSTIQGLEVQRATVATLKSFVDTGMASMARHTGHSGSAEPAGGPSRRASPLEEALGIKPGGEPGGASAQPSTTPAGAAGPGAAAEPASGSAAGDTGRQPERPAQAEPSGQAGQAEADGSAEQPDIVGAAASAAQGWWNLLQQQFQTLAAATAATAEDALSDLAEAGKAAAAAQPFDGAPASAAKSAARKTGAAKKAAGATRAAKTAKAAKSATPAKSARAAKAAAKPAGAKKTAARTAARKTSR